MDRRALGRRVGLGKQLVIYDDWPARSSLSLFAWVKQMAGIHLLTTLTCLFAAVGCAPTVQGDDTAAAQYLLAILEIDRVPEFVDSATTNSFVHGFAQKLSAEQLAYLNQPLVQSALKRFDNASIQPRCKWHRYETDTWSDGHLNNRLHQLSRVVMLRARANYERENWNEGNRDVEYVRILARRMTQQARFFEHQCFMIENMAIGTAAAYLFQLPKSALVDLAERTRRIGVFTPMSDMLISESARLKLVARNFKNGNLDASAIGKCVSPYLNMAEQHSFGLLATQDAVEEIVGLAEFLGEFSNVMQYTEAGAQENASKMFAKYSPNSSLVTAFGKPPMGEYRENAQGVCRGKIFSAVVDILLRGGDDFSIIPDPFGSQSLKLRDSKHGVLLVSELIHHSNIDFQFGHAGRTSK